MEYIILKRDERGYEYLDSNSIELTIFGHFLTTDAAAKDAPSSYKEWSHDNRYKGSGGNITNLDKENGNILISDQFSEEPDGGPFLTITKENFIELLNTWELALKEKPAEIVITKEAGKVIMKFKN